MSEMQHPSRSEHVNATADATSAVDRRPSLNPFDNFVVSELTHALPATPRPHTSSNEINSDNRGKAMVTSNPFDALVRLGSEHSAVENQTHSSSRTQIETAERTSVSFDMRGQFNENGNENKDVIQTRRHSVISDVVVGRIEEEETKESRPNNEHRRNSASTNLARGNLARSNTAPEPFVDSSAAATVSYTTNHDRTHAPAPAPAHAVQEVSEKKDSSHLFHDIDAFALLHNHERIEEESAINLEYPEVVIGQIIGDAKLPPKLSTTSLSDPDTHRSSVDSDGSTQVNFEKECELPPVIPPRPVHCLLDPMHSHLSGSTYPSLTSLEQPSVGSHTIATAKPSAIDTSPGKPKTNVTIATPTELPIDAVALAFEEQTLYIEAMEELYGCPLCLDIFASTPPRLVVACQHCNNLFCMSCITDALTSTEGTCPLCRQPAEPLIPNAEALAAVSSLEAPCIYLNFGCNQSLPRCELDSHESTCDFKRTIASSMSPNQLYSQGASMAAISAAATPPMPPARPSPPFTTQRRRSRSRLWRSNSRQSTDSSDVSEADGGVGPGTNRMRRRSSSGANSTAATAALSSFFAMTGGALRTQATTSNIATAPAASPSSASSSASASATVISGQSLTGSNTCVQQGRQTVGADEAWTCEQCTFLNCAELPHCEMCESARPRMRGGRIRRHASLATERPQAELASSSTSTSSGSQYGRPPTRSQSSVAATSSSSTTPTHSLRQQLTTAMSARANASNEGAGAGASASALTPSRTNRLFASDPQVIFTCPCCAGRSQVSALESTCRCPTCEQVLDIIRSGTAAPQPQPRQRRRLRGNSNSTPSSNDVDSTSGGGSQTYVNVSVRARSDGASALARMHMLLGSGPGLAGRERDAVMATVAMLIRVSSKKIWHKWKALTCDLTASALVIKSQATRRILRTIPVHPFMQVKASGFEMGRVVQPTGKQPQSTNTNVFRCALVENPQSMVAQWYMSDASGGGVRRSLRRAAFNPNSRHVVVLEFGSSSRADMTHFVDILHAVVQAKQRLWDERFTTTVTDTTVTDV